MKHARKRQRRTGRTERVSGKCRYAARSWGGQERRAAIKAEVVTLDERAPRDNCRHVVKWTKLSCHDFVDNHVRLRLFALAYNLGNSLRRLVLPRPMKTWTMTTLRDKLIEIGAKVAQHAKYPQGDGPMVIGSTWLKRVPAGAVEAAGITCAPWLDQTVPAERPRGTITRWITGSHALLVNRALLDIRQFSPRKEGPARMVFSLVETDRKEEQTPTQMTRAGLGTCQAGSAFTEITCATIRACSECVHERTRPSQMSGPDTSPRSMTYGLPSRITVPVNGSSVTRTRPSRTLQVPLPASVSARKPAASTCPATSHDHVPPRDP